MRNRGSLIIAVIWLLVALTLCGFLVKGLNGSGWGWNGKVFSLSWLDNLTDKNSYVFTDEEVVESSYSENSIEMIDVDVVSAPVELRKGSGSSVIVQVTTNLPEEKRPKVSLEGNTLRIKTPSVNNFSFGFYTTKVVITVPESFVTSSRAEKRDIRIDTVSGSILIEKITAGKFNLETVSGSIKLEDCKASVMDLDSTSGSIKVIDGVVESLDVETISGSINAEGKIGCFDADSTSGSIRIKTDTMFIKDCDADSISGSVTVSMPKNDGFVLDFESVSGRVKNGFTGFEGKKSGRDTYGNGKIKIDVETVSGSITVEKE